MELREINAFLQVAQFKSFSKAARHLGYSQAAITIQIKQLEQELDVHLFDRIGKQISLTRMGELFFEHANTICRKWPRPVKPYPETGSFMEPCGSEPSNLSVQSCFPRS